MIESPKLPISQDRQATLLNGLLTPVPTVTPSLLTCQGIHFIYADQDTWIEFGQSYSHPWQ